MEPFPSFSAVKLVLSAQQTLIMESLVVKLVVI